MRNSHPNPRDWFGETWRAGPVPKSELGISRSSEAGYTLAILVMVIAVMAIMMAAAVEFVSFQAQREKEAELIFRGKQYVEGIRLYRQKYGRFPMRMKELWEADPKVLRKKWTDPITESDDWVVVFQGEEGRELVAPGSTGGNSRPTPTRTPVFERAREPEGEKVGPIIGVRSRSTDSSIKVYEGRTQYDLWKFVLEETGPSSSGDTPWGQVDTPVSGGPGRPPGRQPPGQPPGRYTPGPQRTGTPNY